MELDPKGSAGAQNDHWIGQAGGTAIIPKVLGANPDARGISDDIDISSSQTPVGYIAPQQGSRGSRHGEKLGIKNVIGIIEEFDQDLQRFTRRILQLITKSSANASKLKVS